jgi:hypothetical protein
MNHRRLALALALLLSGCGLPPMISDTGYLGTWSRGNDRNVSIVAIAKVGNDYLFRWTKRSFDGQLVVLCDWGGDCSETFRGGVIAHYRIVTTFDPVAGRLYTETLEERTQPEPLTSRYRDEMEVTDGGLTLWNYTIERDGEVFDDAGRPKRSFQKIADSIVDPPPHAAE